MKIYYPSYYKEFSCLAGACPDSCCKKWEIVIDDETLNKYKALKTDFGKKILSEIITDEEGDRCFKLNGSDCPFLNGEGLCDIHLRLGEEYTSEVCRKHPRFTEEYDGFTEISLSLSCPEANRIIMSAVNADYPTPSYSGEDEVLALLIESRAALLACERDFSSLIRLLLDTAADDSLDIDLVYIENHPEINISFLKKLAEFISDNCEILTDIWKSCLASVISRNVSDKAFGVFLKTCDSSLVNICRYFIYRYYLKAVNDLDIYSRALFIAAACLLSGYISFICNIPLAEAARLFSKETEHNLLNIDLMLDYFSKF